jgi:hypothetical protein
MENSPDRSGGSEKEAAIKAVQALRDLYGKGLSDDDLVQQVVARSGLDATRVREWIRGMREGIREGMEEATRRVVTEGVKRAVLGSMPPPQPAGKKILRFAALGLGLFLLLASLGGFKSGDAVTASVVLVLGVGIASLFWLLRPRKVQPS